MKLEPIAEYLHSLGIATPGKDLFAYSAPSSAPNNSVLLVSPLTGTDIDYELPCFRRTKFQVIVRGSDHVEGVKLAEKIMDALTLENSSVMPEISIKYMRPRHEPVVFPSSEGDLLEVSVNYDTVYIIN